MQYETKNIQCILYFMNILLTFSKQLRHSFKIWCPHCYSMFGARDIPPSPATSPHSLRYYMRTIIFSFEIDEKFSA